MLARTSNFSTTENGKHGTRNLTNSRGSENCGKKFIPETSLDSQLRKPDHQTHVCAYVRRHTETEFAWDCLTRMNNIRMWQKQMKMQPGLEIAGGPPKACRMVVAVVSRCLGKRVFKNRCLADQSWADWRLDAGKSRGEGSTPAHRRFSAGVDAALRCTGRHRM